jgi:cytoskeletal protein RodZ
MNTIIRSVGNSFVIVVLVTVAIAVLEIGIINVGHAQVFQNRPGENPMCDPTDNNINGTESRACGVPKTPSATGAAAEPTTTESQSSITPSSPSGSSLEPIPGLLPITSNNTQ